MESTGTRATVHAADLMVAQSQQLTDSAKRLLASARSGGFGFQPAAADTMIAALQDSIYEIHNLRHRFENITQAPKLGRTPAAEVVSPFMPLVATDEQGVMRAVDNLEQILADMVAAYRAAKQNYDETDTIAARRLRRLHR